MPLTGLVVEDEWLLRLELVEELTRAGWTVREAATGESALKLIAEQQEQGEKIDFLVTDIRLGGKIDGWDVAEACREAWPGLPVIYVSANPIVENRRVQGSVVLSKPVEIETLLSNCRRLSASETWMRHVLGMCAVLALLALAAGGAQAETFRECPGCPEMVGVPAGKFLMGSPAHEPGRFDSEGPQHVVTVKAFALGEFDVTSEAFLAFLRSARYQPAPCNPILGLGWKIDGRDLAYPPSQDEPPRWPAVCLSWKDANAYIAWLNAQVKAAHPSLADRPGPYRLPSEAEWEYAARAGTNTSRWWGEDIGAANANCNGCGSEWDDHILAPVDAFAPNPFGLYGMLGNAWQWTQDCWHPSYAGAPVDGSAWETPACASHVLRGGAWNNVPIFIRSAARSGAVVGGDYDYSSLSGFRVARDLP